MHMNILAIANYACECPELYMQKWYSLYQNYASTLGWGPATLYNLVQPA